MNKARERAIVEGFIKWGGRPGLCLREWNRERPDALVTDGTQVIGLEVTAVSEAVQRQAIAPQKWRAEACRVVDAAKKVFESRDPTPVIVLIGMSPNWVPPGRQDAARIAAELSSIIERTLASPPPWPRDKEPFTLKDPFPGVERVYVSRSNYGNHWQSSIAGHVLSVSEADLQATIARKEVELQEYRQAAPTVWLLIDCDVSGQGIALDIPANRVMIPSKFDGVFCCGFGAWQWVQVLTSAPPLGTAG